VLERLVSREEKWRYGIEIELSPPAFHSQLTLLQTALAMIRSVECAARPRTALRPASALWVLWRWFSWGQGRAAVRQALPPQSQSLPDRRRPLAQAVVRQALALAARHLPENCSPIHERPGAALLVAARHTMVGVRRCVSAYAPIAIGTDAMPAIAYVDFGNRDLKVTHCSNVFCVPYWQRR